MLPLRYKWLWLGSGLAGLVAILSLALMPGGVSIPAEDGDKLLHALAFAVLTVWFLGMVEDGRMLRLLVGLVAYALLIEVLQGLSSYRTADARDVVADVVGIGIGWGLAGIGLRGWCSQLEARLGGGRR